MNHINLHNYELFVMDYLDGNLPEEEYRSMKTFLSQHPDVAQEIALMRHVVLEPDTNIVFKHKQMLKKREEEVVLVPLKVILPNTIDSRWKYMTHIAVAASILLCIMVGTYYDKQQSLDMARKTTVTKNNTIELHPIAINESQQTDEITLLPNAIDTSSVATVVKYRKQLIARADTHHSLKKHQQQAGIANNNTKVIPSKTNFEVLQQNEKIGVMSITRNTVKVAPSRTDYKVSQQDEKTDVAGIARNTVKVAPSRTDYKVLQQDEKTDVAGIARNTVKVAPSKTDYKVLQQDEKMDVAGVIQHHLVAKQEKLDGEITNLPKRNISSNNAPNSTDITTISAVIVPVELKNGFIQTTNLFVAKQESSGQDIVQIKQMNREVTDEFLAERMAIYTANLLPTVLDKPNWQENVVVVKPNWKKTLGRSVQKWLIKRKHNSEEEHKQAFWADLVPASFKD